MKILYLDIFSGISGDMLLGALIDLGVDARRLEEELGKLDIGDYHLHIARGQKASIEGVKFDVHVAHEHSLEGTVHAQAHSQAEHSHERSVHGSHGGPLLKIANSQVEISVFETNVPPRFRLYFLDRKGRPSPPSAPGSVGLETLRPDGTRQTFKFRRQKDFLEATTELPEPHEFTGTLRLKNGKRTEACQFKFIEDHHHEHGHGHSHEPGHSHGHGHDRTFNQIRDLIARSKLSDWVRQKATAIFQRIAVAEGKIHGLPPEQVHFHEVGAIDSIVDIVGACIGLELLGRPRVLAGPVVEGTGWIHCAHGRFPIPAPATLAILGARGISVSQNDEPNELVTPTGAALLAEFAESFGPMRELTAEKIGYGLGTRDNKTRPNVLRAVLGEETKAQSQLLRSSPAHAEAARPIAAEEPDLDWETDTVAVLETNLDDINAEILGDFVDKALAAGALDVFHTAIQMKKNRPGVMLTVLCPVGAVYRLTDLMLRETSTFGVRHYTAQRRKLAREWVPVQTPYGEVTVKIGRLKGQVVQAAPEFESCKKLAEETKVPLKQIYEAAYRALGPKGSWSPGQKDKGEP